MSLLCTSFSEGLRPPIGSLNSNIVILADRRTSLRSRSQYGLGSAVLTEPADNDQMPSRALFRQKNSRLLHDFSSRNSRQLFIRKVLSIVLSQLLATAGTTYFLMSRISIALYLMTRGRHIMLLLFAMSMGAVLALTRSEQIRYQKPYNFMLLGLFTLCQSIMMGVFSSQFPVKSVILGSSHTIMALFAVILYSTQPNPRFDLTYTGNGLLALLSSLFVGTVANLYFESTVLDNVVLALSAALFVAYTMRDVQLIIGQKKDRYYGEDDYIIAALGLYESIINLLIRMTEIAHRMQDAQSRKRSQPF